LARHRIRTSSTPLAVIAETVGYQSESAFTRAYRRRFDVTPSEDRTNIFNPGESHRRKQP
jgi:transcriptional regulator GlxA family with amidase domain